VSLRLCGSLKETGIWPLLKFFSGFPLFSAKTFFMTNTGTFSENQCFCKILLKKSMGGKPADNVIPSGILLCFSDFFL